MFDLMRKMRIDTTEFCLNTFSDYEKDYVDKLAAVRCIAACNAVRAAVVFAQHSRARRCGTYFP